MPQKRPNLLLITTDQQRGDCLWCAGHPVLETPYLDQLAERGAYLPQAYTSVPSCTPARAGIITGMDQWNHGRLTMTGADALEYPATLPGQLDRLSGRSLAPDKENADYVGHLCGAYDLGVHQAGEEQRRPRGQAKLREPGDRHHALLRAHLDTAAPRPQRAPPRPHPCP